jgi:hypothetical protein
VVGMVDELVPVELDVLEALVLGVELLEILPELVLLVLEVLLVLKVLLVLEILLVLVLKGLLVLKVLLLVLVEVLSGEVIPIVSLS